METTETTYEGHFLEDGTFISNGAVVDLPVHTRITIMFPGEMKTKSQRQKEALARLVSSMNQIDDEPFDEEFDAILNKRFTIARELDI